MKRLLVPWLCVPLVAAATDELRDPWVPPAVRHAASAPETRGAALQAQAERKLRAMFEAADTERRGGITREQARAAGLGAVADQFDRIDEGKRGRVTFEDVRRYWQRR
jgi:hypothetical protein